MNIDHHDGAWVPDTCTLPTVDRPLRVAEFDAFFATDVTEITRTTSGSWQLAVRPAAAGRAAELAANETSCCSFFTFELTITSGAVTLTVSAPDRHDVLEALAARAEEAIIGATR